MRLMIIISLMWCTHGSMVKRQEGTLTTLSEADKDNLLQLHNDFRAQAGASNMMKMVIFNDF